MKFGKAGAKTGWGLLDKIFSLLYPSGRECLICGMDAGFTDICPGCAEEIKCSYDLAFCPVCGRYRPKDPKDPKNAALCQECREVLPAFLTARSVGPYRGALKEAIHLYKYKGYRSLADFFVPLLSAAFWREPAFSGTDVLVPVPLTPDKMKSRGFNQAELLAVKTGEILNLPVSTALTRLKQTPSQSRLIRAARQDYIQGVFAVCGEINPGNVLLVDDILTTGATAGECARVLLRAGAKSVRVLTLASGIQEKLNDNGPWKRREMPEYVEKP